MPRTKSAKSSNDFANIGQPKVWLMATKPRSNAGPLNNENAGLVRIVFEDEKNYGRL